MSGSFYRRGFRRRGFGRPGFRVRLGGLNSTVCALIREMSTCFVCNVKPLLRSIYDGNRRLNTNKV
jgi:hypothetical protein